MGLVANGIIGRAVSRVLLVQAGHVRPVAEPTPTLPKRDFWVIGRG